MQRRVRSHVTVNGIVFIAMQRLTLDAYVTDVLMPDLVGHDRRPAAFVVYLYLLRHSRGGAGDSVRVSLQTIASRTGLSKSSVQSSIRHLKRRRLLDPELRSTVTAPVRRIVRPWLKRGA
jgi:Helix-turn-helix domain